MIKIDPGELPKRRGKETLTDFAEKLSDWYLRRHARVYRKERGQYFTPKRIAEFMVRLFDEFGNNKHLRILDPGAGIGIFESALCERVRLRNSKISMSFDLYENSEEVLPLLELNMKMCEENMAQDRLNISYRIMRENFILTHTKHSVNEADGWGQHHSYQYDLVICNPPYYKLKKGSAEGVAMREIFKGHSNMYVLFMAMATNLLREGGQLVFLTPRSYCSGVYFKDFRKWFFHQITPIKLHVFESRRVLEKDSVLQEMMLLKGIKGRGQTPTVEISTSMSEPGLGKELAQRRVPIKKVVVQIGDDIIMRIPISDTDEMIGEEVDRLPFTLASLGLRTSTGPLVPFRAKESLFNSGDTEVGFAPLIWMENIKDGKVIWPLANSRKPKAVRIAESTERLRIPNGNYVMVKRFSTKEGKRRINAGVFLEHWLNAQSISIENHVNYVYKVGVKMTEDEVYGLTEILNSRLYNRYFQVSNGSTQVDASAINSIPLPSLDVIAMIGRLAKKAKTEEVLVRQHLVMNTLGITPAISDRLLDGVCNKTIRP